MKGTSNIFNSKYISIRKSNYKLDSQNWNMSPSPLIIANQPGFESLLILCTCSVIKNNGNADILNTTQVNCLVKCCFVKSLLFSIQSLSPSLLSPFPKLVLLATKHTKHIQFVSFWYHFGPSGNRTFCLNIIHNKNKWYSAPECCWAFFLNYVSL